MKYYILFYLLLSSFMAYNQVLKGTILDKETKKPVDAIVYFNGTFLATNTGKDGNFELDFSGFSGMPLTISALGYYSATINGFSAEKHLVVYLVPKVFELTEVVVSDNNVKQDKREREKNLQLFRRQFIGETPNSRQCKILNENDISLVKEHDTLKAFASKPILISNASLGYKITFFLDKFEYDGIEGIAYCKGNILFNQDLESKDSQEKRFERKRRSAYFGSRMQFFRALWNNQLDPEGFTLSDSAKNKLSADTITADIPGKSKFLNYKGTVWIKYRNEYSGSRLTILKDTVSFDRNGSSVENICWFGKIGQQRIADTLPFEYYPEEQSDEARQREQNMLLNEEIQPQQTITPAGNKALNNSLPGEKIYLHLDRPDYMQGDTIWFKAYAWFGFDQLPDTVSKVLYVDLLTPEGKIAAGKKLLILNGASAGEFPLDKEISPGKYTISAYTRWMQNEAAGEPFYTNIRINSNKEDFQVECLPRVIRKPDGDSLRIAFRFFEIDQGGDLKRNAKHQVNYTLRIGDQELKKAESLALNTSEQLFECALPKIPGKDSCAVINLSVNDGGIRFEKQFSIPLKEDLDVQFFPEGGQLVYGVENRIAFKAIGRDGLSREVKGAIREDVEGNGESGREGKITTPFESLHKGMGDFVLTPVRDKKYTAWIEYNHRLYNYPLPQPGNGGITLSAGYTEYQDTIHVKVKYDPGRKEERMYLAGSSYGKIRFISRIKTSADSSFISIPVEFLPEGISRITLFDSDFNPVSERLIYNEKGEKIRVEISADSVSYGLRSKVTLRIRTMDIDSNPVSANLSLSVIDKDQISENKSVGGISSYKLLQSEIKGFIEDPEFYFSDHKTNLKAIDLLLLTQGYRRFIPQKPEIKYYPERDFDISGKVSLREDSKNKKFNYNDLVLNFLCPSGNAYFDQLRPDSLGKFSFHIPLQNGKTLSILRAYTSSGKMTRAYMDNLLRGNEAFTSKGKPALLKEKSFKGDIIIDEPAPTPVFTPPLALPEISSPVIDYVRQLQETRKSELSKTTNGIKWQIDLPEFTVRGKSRDKDWYTRFEDEAKKIIDMDSIDPTGKKYGSVYDLLIKDFGARKFRGADFETVFLPCISMRWDYFLPIYVINGQTYCNGGEGASTPGLLNMIPSIRVNEIKRIMVLPPGNLTYHYANPGIAVKIKQSLVNIETYSKNTYRGDPDGIRTFIIDGLDSARVFYSPRYENLNKNNPVYDSRATFYWNPSLLTDFKGESKVEFYTGDRRTLMEVIINGIQLGNGNTGEKKAEIKISR